MSSHDLDEQKMKQNAFKKSFERLKESEEDDIVL